MNADGSHLTHVTDCSTTHGPPDWSPDGRSLVEAGNDYPSIIDVDSMQRRNLTLPTSTEFYNPQWSPDGQRIAFVGSLLDDSIYIVNADGTNFTRFRTEKPGINRLVWSPDGRKIAFHTQGNNQQGQSYIIDIDDSDQKVKPLLTSQDVVESWSPDGQRILFTSTRDGGRYNEIYVMNIDGSNQKRLTDNDAIEIYPNWSPNAQYITYASNREGNLDIYVMDADGNNRMQLTNEPADDNYPLWLSVSPASMKIPPNR
jgi:Tol biopolymer transport system component